MQHGAAWKAEGKLFGSVASVVIAGEKVLLFKPSTFMNESGKGVRAVAQFYKIPLNETLVVHDELDLDPGVARLKFDGGHGGQNGLRDIIRVFGGDTKFHRLRVGIGHPGHKDRVVGYVLSKPNAGDTDKILDAIISAADVMDLVVAGNVMDAMTRLHTPR